MIKTPFEMAQTFQGTTEVGGMMDNPFIMAFLTTDDKWPEHDEVPWCSGFINFICKCCRLQRSKSLAAKSWLNFGLFVSESEVEIGFDIVILSRPGGHHVGFFAGWDGSDKVRILGGNQTNSVNITSFQRSKVLGYRRLT